MVPVMDTPTGIAVTSFLVGLSGAMMPGPVLTVTIGETAARLKGGGSGLVLAGGSQAAAGRGPLVRAALVGPLIVLGHAILEVCLVIAIVLGLGRFLAETPVLGTIGVIGGLIALGLAWGLVEAQAVRLRRIVEAPVQGVVVSGKDGAGLACTVADSDHIVELPTQELRHRFAARPGPIDADLAEDLHRVRVDDLGLGACRVDVEVGSSEIAQKRFGYLAARGVAGANE